MLAAATDRVVHLLVAERGTIFQLDRTQGTLRPRVAQTDGADSLKRGGPFMAEDAARLQKFFCPPGTILDACRRLAHLGQA